MATLTFTEEQDKVRSVIKKEDKTNLDILELTVPLNTTFEIGDTVNYVDNAGNTIFSGILSESDEKELTTLIVYDKGHELQDITINKLYNNQSPESIIEDIITNFTSLTFVSTISSGETIDRYKAINKKAWDVVTEMSEALLANFSTDVNGNFNLELEGENRSTKSINSNKATLVGGWKRDRSSVVNEVRVVGDEQIVRKNPPQTFSGDGSTTEFTLDEIPIDIKIDVGGTAQDIYVEGEGSGDVKIEKENKKIIFDSAPPNKSDNISVDYTFKIPINVRRRDKDSIDTYKKRSETFERNYIKTRDDARKFARFIIDRFSDPPREGEWIFRNSQSFKDFALFVPNELIPVEDNIRNFSGDLIIRRVQRRYPEGEVSVVVGTPRKDVLFWQKEVQKRIKDLEEKDDNSEDINEDENIVEKIDIPIPIRIKDLILRTFDADKFYLEEDSNGTRNQMVEDGTGPVMREQGFTDEPIGVIFLTTEDGDVLTTEGGDSLIEE